MRKREKERERDRERETKLGPDTTVYSNNRTKPKEPKNYKQTVTQINKS